MINLHPVAIVASSLPIYGDAVERYPHLKHIEDAMHFCQQLCNLAAVSAITVREYDAIARVAYGDLWPNCYLLETLHHGRRRVRIVFPDFAASILQPGLGELLDEWHIYRVDAHGIAEELQAKLDAPNHAIKFWTAGGELAATGVYPEH